MPKTNPTPDPTRTPQADLAPFYAVAGLADVISETLRATLAERQARAAQRFNEEIKVNADELRDFLADLPNQVRALPETTRTRLNELQRQAEELLAQANSTYSTLAGRGKRVVDDRVGAVRGTAARTRTATEAAAEDVADAAEEAVATTGRNVTGRPTKKSAPRKKAAPSEAAAEADVSPAEATEQAREAAAKQPTKTTPAKKTPAKKAAAKQTTAKKAPSAKAATAGPAMAQEHPVVEAAPDVAPDAGPVSGPGTES